LVGADIRTNDAEIVLDGVGANFYNAATGANSALANFATNAAGGRFTIRNGRDFTTTGALSNNGIVNVGGATILSAPGGLTNTSTGLVAGTGTIAAAVLNAGIFAPGDDNQLAGLLTIQGDVTEQAGSQFLMDLGGTARGSTYDVVNISGTLHFGGSLNVTMTDDLTLILGMTFDLFDFGTGDGQFAAINLPTLSDGLVWDAGNLYTTGTILVIPEPSTISLLATGIMGLLAFVGRRRWGT
jgi:hypothetical protein